MRILTFAAATLVLVTANVRALDAQQPDSAAGPRGAFIGRIINAVDSTAARSVDVRLMFVDSVVTRRTSRGVDSLEVFIDSTRSRLGSTDSTGAFAIRRLAAGRYMLVARRIGFAPIQGVVKVDSGTVATVLPMNPTSRLLSKVTVTERAGNRVTEQLDRAGFVTRSHSGIGATFIDRQEILRRRPQTVADILAAYGIHGGDVILDRMPLVYEDVRDYPADLVIGVEVYRHGRPTEFNMTRGGPLALESGAGDKVLVVIWTFIP